MNGRKKYPLMDSVFKRYAIYKKDAFPKKGIRNSLTI